MQRYLSVTYKRGIPSLDQQRVLLSGGFRLAGKAFDLISTKQLLNWWCAHEADANDEEAFDWG